MSSPFPYDSPVAAADLIDRDAEAVALRERAVAGRNTRLVAPRRYGKTSLARRLLGEASSEGSVGVYVNFVGVLTVDDVAERFERSYREQSARPARPLARRCAADDDP